MPIERRCAASIPIRIQLLKTGKRKLGFDQVNCP
jgi:hypothetical protein